MSIYKWLSASAVLAVVLAGCGGGGGGGNSGGTIPTPPPGDNTVNQAPSITSLSPQGSTAEPVIISPGATQHVVVAATDPDSDPLTYSWSVDNGRVTGTGAAIDFKAPDSACVAMVKVEVSDDHGHKVSADCCFSVSDGSNNPDPTKNDSPVINSLIANPDSVDVSGKSTITVDASDPDGDPLTVSWSADSGTLDPKQNNTADWTAPSVKGSYNVIVSISDGHNPAVTKSVAISVAGQVNPPITNGLTAQYVQNDHVAAHPDLSKGQVVFSRVDANLNFDWERLVPDPRLITLPDTQNGHDFGVIWTGYIKCEKPGAYAFRARFDDGFRLAISDDSNKMVTVIDGWLAGPGTFDGQITLQGQKWYKIQAEYFEDEDRCYVQLFWLTPGATDYTIVPTDAFRTQ